MRAAALVLVLVCATACGGSELPPLAGGARASYREHVEPLVVERCESCHNRRDPQGDLVLEQGAGYGQLVGRRSVQAPGTELVAPGDPQASYLWQKLEATAPVGKGMPRTLFGTRQLPAGELERFRRWIADGALP